MDLNKLFCELLEIPNSIKDVRISGLSADSREIKPGYLFAAIQGAAGDGRQHILQAIEEGASAILVADSFNEEDCSIAVIKVENPRLVLAKIAARFYDCQPKTIVAVTGTAGKTSVASFVRQVWAHCGKAAAMIGTTGVTTSAGTAYGSLTTPGPVVLHGLLASLAKEDVTHVSMEASSHGLDQYRLDGVQLSAAGFTNLGHDHLDYHANVDEYLAAKMRLFTELLKKGQPAVIYADDKYSERVIEVAKNAGLKVLTVGRAGTFLTLKRVEHLRHNQLAEIHHENKIYEVNLPLAGGFQLSNALVAGGLALAVGGEPKKVMAALAKLTGAPGRLELVGTSKKGAPIYVDYSHKPDALEIVLKSVRPFTTNRILLVFGCGGDRDRTKRPIMGRIAEEFADLTIVTDDNPRSEDAALVRGEILVAAPNAIEIGDRATAINEAISRLEEGDTLIIAGKGHEEGQIVGDKILPFSDHQQARGALAKEV